MKRIGKNPPLDLPTEEANETPKDNVFTKALGFTLGLLDTAIGGTLQLVGYGTAHAEETPVVGIPVKGVVIATEYTVENVGAGHRNGLADIAKRRIKRVLAKFEGDEIESFTDIEKAVKGLKINPNRLSTIMKMAQDEVAAEQAAAQEKEAAKAAKQAAKTETPGEGAASTAPAQA